MSEMLLAVLALSLCVGLGAYVGYVCQLPIGTVSLAPPDAEDCLARVKIGPRCRSYLRAVETWQGRSAAARYGALNVSDVVPRMAVATLWDGSAKYACALGPWCFSASTLANRLPWKVDLVVIAPRSLDSAGCAGVATFETRHHGKTGAAIAAYAARRGTWRSADGVVHASVLQKISVLALTDFPLVLFSDLDVNLSPMGALPEPPWWTPSQAQTFPFRFSHAGGLGQTTFAEQWGRVVNGIWGAHLGAFLRSPDVLLAGHPDHEAPINTGLMLIKPRRWLYDDALSTLAQAEWSASGGFVDAAAAPRSELSGGRDSVHKMSGRLATMVTPRARANSSRLLHRLLLGTGGRKGYVQRGGSHAMTPSRLWQSLEHIGHIQRNSWQFVGGEHDQGFFWHLIFLKHHAGTWLTTVNAAAPMPDGELSPRHTAANLAAFVSRADHYWGLGRNFSKPWEERAGVPKCTRDFLGAKSGTTTAEGATRMRLLPTATDTECGRMLRRLYTQSLEALRTAPPRGISGPAEGCYGAAFRMLPSFACTAEGDAAGVPCGKTLPHPSWLTRAILLG